MYDSDKTALLFDIKPLSLDTIFPGTEGRRYSAKWEENFPGYVTQTTKNFKMQDFVLTVSAFGSHTDRNYVLTGLGFMDWKKATVLKRGILVSHNESRKHQDAISKAKTLSKDKKDIYASILKSYAEKVSRNREIILRIINIVVVLGQQNRAFRGHTWNKETKSEDGNFTRFLRWKAEGLLLTHNTLAWIFRMS